MVVAIAVQLEIPVHKIKTAAPTIATMGFASAVSIKINAPLILIAAPETVRMDIVPATHSEAPAQAS